MMKNVAMKMLFLCVALMIVILDVDDVIHQPNFSTLLEHSGVAYSHLSRLGGYVTFRIVVNKPIFFSFFLYFVIEKSWVCKIVQEEAGLIRISKKKRKQGKKKTNGKGDAVQNLPSINFSFASLFRCLE